MIRIKLTDAEARRPERAFLQATERELRDRTQVVRLAHRGRPHQDIADDLGITPRTVQRRLNAYLRGGLAALAPRKAKGHPPALPAHLARDIRHWVIDGPAGPGLDRAKWTHAESADHLLIVAQRRSDSPVARMAEWSSTASPERTGANGADFGHFS